LQPRRTFSPFETLSKGFFCSRLCKLGRKFVPAPEIDLLHRQTVRIASQSLNTISRSKNTVLKLASKHVVRRFKNSKKRSARDYRCKSYLLWIAKAKPAFARGIRKGAKSPLRVYRAELCLECKLSKCVEDLKAQKSQGTRGSILKRMVPLGL